MRRVKARSPQMNPNSRPVVVKVAGVVVVVVVTVITGVTVVVAVIVLGMVVLMVVVVAVLVEFMSRDVKAILVDWFRCLHGTRRSRVQSRALWQDGVPSRIEDCIFAPECCKCYGYLSSKED